MSGFNRRNFLKGLGASALFLSSPEKLLMGSILDGALNKAQAAINGSTEKILINIFANGGTPRWLFDLPLRPNGNDSLIDNGMAKNRFVLENGNIRAVVDSHKVGNFYLPYLWKDNIPTSNGGSVPMANLAQSAVFIRGYNLVNDGHEQNIIKHNCPVPGFPSLSGIFADHSKKPFPAVTTGNSFQHKSTAGKSILSAPLNGDPFSALMAPFNLATPKSFNRRQAMDEAIKALQNNVSAFYGSQNSLATSLAGERDSAIELFTKGTAGLQARYTALYNKYRSLELRSYTESNLEGIEDLEIRMQKNAFYNMRTSVGNVELRSGGADFRNIIDSSSHVSSMAESFAIAEYIVTEKLSSSIILEMGGMKINLDNLNYMLISNGSSVSGPADFAFDAHETGSHASLFVFTKFYRALAASMYELISVLQQKNLYSDTIIQFSSDFNRSGKTAGNGSDHGFNGSAISLYSGMFQANDGPLVIGNVDNNKNGGEFSGSWGLGAPVPEMSGRILTIGNIMSTVTGLAGYETPTRNDPPLLKMINGKLVNLAGLPRNIG